MSTMPSASHPMCAMDQWPTKQHRAAASEHLSAKANVDLVADLSGTLTPGTSSQFPEGPALGAYFVPLVLSQAPTPPQTPEPPERHYRRAKSVKKPNAGAFSGTSTGVEHHAMAPASLATAAVACMSCSQDMHGFNAPQCYASALPPCQWHAWNLQDGRQCGATWHFQDFSAAQPGPSTSNKAVRKNPRQMGSCRARVKGKSCANWQKDASLAVDESICEQAHHQETASNTVLTVDTSEVNELSKAKKRKTSSKPHTSYWTDDSENSQHCDVNHDACTNMDSNAKPNDCTYAASPSDVEDILAIMVDFPRAGGEKEEGASAQHCAGDWYSSHDDLMHEDSFPASEHELTSAFIEHW